MLYNCICDDVYTAFCICVWSQIELLVICLLYFSTAVLLMFGILSLLQVHIVSDILQLSEGIFILVGTGNLFMPAKLN